jgi:hypothetical protein
MPAKITHRGCESPMLNLNPLPLQSAFGLIIRRMKMLSFIIRVTTGPTKAIRQIHGLYRLSDCNTCHVSLFCDPLLKALNPKIPRLFAKRRIQRIIKSLSPSPENGRQGPSNYVESTWLHLGSPQSTMLVSSRRQIVYRRAALRTASQEYLDP